MAKTCRMRKFEPHLIILIIICCLGIKNPLTPFVEKIRRSQSFCS